MKKLSKSKQEYLSNGGWSSSFFFDVARHVITELEKRDIEIKFGRTVIYIGESLKAYVHHNGRSKEYLTFTDMKGQELRTFHFTEDKEDILKFILKFF